MRTYAELLAESLEVAQSAGTEDARARLSRLYRELGTSAVAAALVPAPGRDETEGAAAARVDGAEDSALLRHNRAA